MKTLARLAVLFPLLAACGGAAPANSQAPESECSYTLPADASALQMHRALNAALEGNLDPCGGAIARGPSTNLSLQRVDAALNANGQRLFTLVFRVAAN